MKQFFSQNVHYKIVKFKVINTSQISKIKKLYDNIYYFNSKTQIFNQEYISVEKCLFISSLLYP